MRYWKGKFGAIIAKISDKKNKSKDKGNMDLYGNKFRFEKIAY